MADEDERWLYGDSNPDEEQEKQENLNSSLDDTTQEATKDKVLEPPEIRHEEEKSENEKDESKEEGEEDPSTKGSPKGDVTEDENKDKKENGEIDDDDKDAGEDDEDDDEDEDDDSDEDNVNVIIGDINKTGPTYTNLNIPKRGPNITGPGVKSSGKFSVDDFESVGVINGVPAHEFNVDILEDKPWRIPGADITDYFNYGFNEDTWKAYCERQKRIRIHESCTGLPTQTLPGQSWTASQGPPSAQFASSQAQGNKKPGWETGQIRVIGAGVASRRLDEGGPENQNIQVLPPNSNFPGVPPPNMMPPLIPLMEMPPPGRFSGPGDHYGSGPGSSEYFNMEPDYFSSYEPTAADQWRDGWAPGNLVTFGQSVKQVHSHLDDSSQDRKDRERSRDRDRDERDRDRDDKDKRKDRSHRNRSRSKSHERKKRSRSRSPSHKKHKKKSKKSDKKKRSDDGE